MPMSGPSAAAARAKHSNRYGPEAQIEAEARHLLYLEVRRHLKDGWEQLPEGLTPRNLRDLAVMAKARSDRRIHALCRSACSARTVGAGGATSSPPQSY
jgi:hypothetical protein